MARWAASPADVPEWAFVRGEWQGEPTWHGRLVRLVRWRLADKYSTNIYASSLTLGSLAESVVDGKMLDAFDLTDDNEQKKYLREQVQYALDQLSDKQRLVVQELVFEGKRQEELAYDLGISQPAVCKLYERACTRLERLLSRFNSPLVEACR